MEDCGYDGGMAVIHAGATAELARRLALSSGDRGGLLSVAEAAEVLESVGLLLESIPTTLDQVGRWVDREVSTGRVEVIHGPYVGHPAEAASVVLAYAVAVRGMLREARRGVTSAQLIVASLDDPDVAVERPTLSVVH